MFGNDTNKPFVQSSGSGGSESGQFPSSSSGGTYDVVQTREAGSHNHTFSGTASTTGSSGTNANLPPYYALAYIMKA